MKKVFYGLLLSAAAGTLLLGSPAEASSAKVPSYVEIPDKGEYTMGDEEKAEKTGEGFEAGTDFYLYIENPGKKGHGSSSGSSASETGNPAVTVAAMLPKTGDSGMDLNALLLLALACGAGYLFCEYHAEKKV